MIKGVELASTRARWRRRTRRGTADGVDTVPAIWVDGDVLSGERAIPADAGQPRLRAASSTARDASSGLGRDRAGRGDRDRHRRVVLFWDTRPRDTGKLARALRADLAQLDADEFLAKWRRYEA